MRVDEAHLSDYVQNNHVKPTTVKSFPFSTSLFFRKSKDKFSSDIISIDKNEKNSKENLTSIATTTKDSFFTVNFLLFKN